MAGQFVRCRSIIPERFLVELIRISRDANDRPTVLFVCISKKIIIPIEVLQRNASLFRVR